jgi:hypothetical protein
MAESRGMNPLVIGAVGAAAVLGAVGASLFMKDKRHRKTVGRALTTIKDQALNTLADVQEVAPAVVRSTERLYPRRTQRMSGTKHGRSIKTVKKSTTRSKSKSKK